MDPTIIGLLMIGFLLVLVLLGFDLAVALGTLSFAGVWWIEGDIFISFNLIADSAYHAVKEYTLSVVPMFIMMALFANLSGAADDAYEGVNVLMVKVKGGLAMATVMANAIFAAICGASIASAAIFSKISLPQMERRGYDRKFALGTVAGSSILGMLIPPSILMIVYGVIVDESIGRLFVAGLLPGLLLMVIYCFGIIIMVRFRPEIAGDPPDLASRTVLLIMKSILKPWQFIVIIAISLGGIYAGWFTPTEAGAIGAFATFLMCILRKKLNNKALMGIIHEAGFTMASLYFLFICATMYSRMLSFSGLPFVISDSVTTIQLQPIYIILAMIVIYVLLGAVIDSVSIMILTIPLFHPVVQSMGFDPYWFAVISVIAIEMGLITPPFGMVVFAMKASIGDSITIEEIFKGVFPWILMMVIALIILILFPSLSTFLPHKMAG